MDYVKYIRKMVGHQPIILSGSSVVVINSESQVLLQLRKDNNLWGLPGGAMNLGESFEEVAKREVYEETGLTIKDMKLLDIFSGDELYYVYPNGDEAYSIIALYESRTFEGALRLDQSESKDLKFFDIANLPEKIAPPEVIHKFLLKHYS